MLRICAWVFSNTGCNAEAADAYRAMLGRRPNWPEGHRHLSGALAAAGLTGEAVAAALHAVELAPHDGEFACHAGVLLLEAGRAQAALLCLDHAVRLQPGNARALCAMATAFAMLGRSAEAAAAARRATDMRPGEPAAVADAAETLMRCGRAGEAAELLRQATRGEGGAVPRLWRLLSAAEMLLGDDAAALAAIGEALAVAPDEAEYHLHRGHLLWRLGDTGGAASAFAHAAALMPDSAEARRAQMGLYLAAGLVREATAVGGELLQRFPDDRPAAEAMLHLLDRRLDTIDGEYVLLGETASRMPRPPRPPPGFADRSRAQCRVIAALILRETRTRFADVRLGYGWALLEPILHIALLSAAFAVLMHGRPPIGTHFFLFYYTGLIRYYGATP